MRMANWEQTPQELSEKRCCVLILDWFDKLKLQSCLYLAWPRWLAKSSSLYMTALNCAFGRLGLKNWYQKTWRKLLHEKK